MFPTKETADANISIRDQQVLNLLFNPDSSFPSTSLGGSETKKVSIPPETLSILKKTELEGVKAAEEKDLTKAIEIFTECIKLCPEYASAYNNRAQTYRLRGHDDLAMEDLNKAIEYAAGDAEILKQSYTQRGIIHKKLNNSEAALADFQKGAQFGNEIARMASVQENPYAQLCGATLQEVMKNLVAPK